LARFFKLNRVSVATLAVLAIVAAALAFWAMRAARGRRTEFWGEVWKEQDAVDFCSKGATVKDLKKKIQSQNTDPNNPNNGRKIWKQWKDVLTAGCDKGRKQYKESKAETVGYDRENPTNSTSCNVDGAILQGLCPHPILKKKFPCLKSQRTKGTKEVTECCDLSSSCMTSKDVKSATAEAQNMKRKKTSGTWDPATLPNTEANPRVNLTAECSYYKRSYNSAKGAWMCYSGKDTGGSWDTVKNLQCTNSKECIYKAYERNNPSTPLDGAVTQ